MKHVFLAVATLSAGCTLRASSSLSVSNNESWRSEATRRLTSLRNRLKQEIAEKARQPYHPLHEFKGDILGLCVLHVDETEGKFMGPRHIYEAVLVASQLAQYFEKHNPRIEKKGENKLIDALSDRSLALQPGRQYKDHTIWNYNPQDLPQEAFKGPRYWKPDVALVKVRSSDSSHPAQGRIALVRTWIPAHDVSTSFSLKRVIPGSYLERYSPENVAHVEQWIESQARLLPDWDALRD